MGYFEGMTLDVRERLLWALVLLFLQPMPLGPLVLAFFFSRKKDEDSKFRKYLAYQFTILGVMMALIMLLLIWPPIMLGIMSMFSALTSFQSFIMPKYLVVWLGLGVLLMCCTTLFFFIYVMVLLIRGRVDMLFISDFAYKHLDSRGWVFISIRLF